MEGRVVQQNLQITDTLGTQDFFPDCPFFGDLNNL